MKNDCGSVSVICPEQDAAVTDEIERKLDEADQSAASDPVRYKADEVFGRIKDRMSGKNHK